MKGIYKFEWDFSYGILSGIFTADSEDISLLENNNIVLKFGEVLGKHSYLDDVRLNPGDFIKVTDNQDLVKAFEDNNMYCGYNPLNILISNYFMNVPEKVLSMLPNKCLVDMTAGEYIKLLKKLKGGN